MAKEQDKEKEQSTHISASQLVETSMARDIITSSISLDIGLSGGLPLGSTVLFGGKYKCGKTTLALFLGSISQRKYGSKIFFFNIEGRLDHKVLSQIPGLDLKNFEVIMGPPIYDKKDKDKVVGYRKMSAQTWWTKIGECITNNPRSIIIVDSISALSDEAELAQGMGFFGRGSQQKLEAQFTRQYSDLVVPSQITLFLLAQIQANTSGYGETIQIKCGNAIRHSADCIMFVKNVEKWKPNSDGGKILGHDMQIRIDCSPLGCPYLDTVVPLRFGSGIDTYLDIARNSITWGLIKKSGARYVLPFLKDDNKFTVTNIPEVKEDEEGFVKAHGEENLRQIIAENPKMMEKLDKALREKIFI